MASNGPETRYHSTTWRRDGQMQRLAGSPHTLQCRAFNAYGIQLSVSRVTINRMSFEDYKKIRGFLEDFATVHSVVTTAAEVFEELKSFNEAKWAFRGQGKDW